MTIALGFVCPDGLVVGTDTLLSSDVKQYGHKIWHHPSISEDWYFGVAGAGDYTHLQAVKDALFDAIDPQMPTSKVRRITGSVIAKYFSGHAYKAPLYQPGEFGVLVLSRHGQTLRLLQNSESVCADVSQYVCLGSGSTIGKYLVDKFVFRSMNARTARMVTAYAVSEAIKKADGCGGEMELWTIPKHGLPIKNRRFDQFDHAQDFIGALHEQLTFVLNAGFDDPAAGAVNSFAEQLRRQFVETAERLYGLAQRDPYNWGEEFNKHSKEFYERQEAEIERRAKKRVAELIRQRRLPPHVARLKK